MKDAKIINANKGLIKTKNQYKAIKNQQKIQKQALKNQDRANRRQAKNTRRQLRNDKLEIKAKERMANQKVNMTRQAILGALGAGSEVASTITASQYKDTLHQAANNAIQQNITGGANETNKGNTATTLGYSPEFGASGREED